MLTWYRARALVSLNPLACNPCREASAGRGTRDGGELVCMCMRACVYMCVCDAGDERWRGWRGGGSRAPVEISSV